MQKSPKVLMALGVYLLKVLARLTVLTLRTLIFLTIFIAVVVEGLYWIFAGKKYGLTTVDWLTNTLGNAEIWLAAKLNAYKVECYCVVCSGLLM